MSTTTPEQVLPRLMRRAVGSKRVLAAQVAMAVTCVIRTACLQPLRAAEVVLVTVAVMMLMAWAFGAWKVVDVGILLVAVASLAPLVGALAILLSRDSTRPGDEVTARRWSPRDGWIHQAADTLFALAVSATIAGYLLAVLQDPAIGSAALAELRWISAHGIELGLVAIVLIIGCSLRALASCSPPESAPQPQPTHSQSWIVPRWLEVTLLVVGICVALLLALSLALSTRWLPRLPIIQRHPGVWAMGVVFSCAVLYALWTVLRRHQPRRPILLVINNLDWCNSDPVRLLKTVYALTCEPVETRLLRICRRPAPLIVLLLADGSRLRNVSETAHEWLLKVADDTVLVPVPADDQA